MCVNKGIYCSTCIITEGSPLCLTVPCGCSFVKNAVIVDSMTQHVVVQRARNNGLQECVFFLLPRVTLMYIS